MSRSGNAQDLHLSTQALSTRIFLKANEQFHWFRVDGRPFGLKTMSGFKNSLVRVQGPHHNINCPLTLPKFCTMTLFWSEIESRFGESGGKPPPRAVSSHVTRSQTWNLFCWNYNPLSAYHAVIKARKAYLIDRGNPVTRRSEPKEWLRIELFRFLFKSYDHFPVYYSI